MKKVALLFALGALVASCGEEVEQAEIQVAPDLNNRLEVRLGGLNALAASTVQNDGCFTEDTREGFDFGYHRAIVTLAPYHDFNSKAGIGQERAGIAVRIGEREYHFERPYFTKDVGATCYRINADYFSLKK